MCIRDSPYPPYKLVFVPSWDIAPVAKGGEDEDDLEQGGICLLYTSDAADERSSVDLGGRRIIKKKKRKRTTIN